jgi:hypothetical protein
MRAAVVVDDHSCLCGMMALADIALNASAVTVVRETSEPTLAIARGVTTAA